MKRHASKGFIAAELVVGVIVIALVALTGFLIYTIEHKHQQKYTDTTASSSQQAATGKGAKQLAPAALIDQLKQALPKQYSYVKLQDEGTGNPYSTNWFGNHDWWVTGQNGVDLSFDLETTYNGLWQDVPAADQAKLTDEANNVTGYVRKSLQAAGYNYQEAATALGAGASSGVQAFTSAAGLYHGTSGDCLLLGWQGPPPHFELRCATGDTINQAVAAAKPLVTLFANAQTSRPLNTVQVGTPQAVKASGAYSYQALLISSPDAVDTHDGDGLNFFVKKDNDWRYVGGQNLCSDAQAVTTALQQLHVDDRSAPQAINDYCSSALN